MMRFNPPARRPNPVFSEEYKVLRTVLADERRRAGLSQAGLAARLGKASSHIAMIERGQRRIDSLELFLMAKCLDADPMRIWSRIVRDLEALEAAGRQQPQAST